MNAVPRQGYFLGKIVKGVKKAVGSVADAAGKVLKSDAGKMQHYLLLVELIMLGGGTKFMGGAKECLQVIKVYSRFGNQQVKNLLLKESELNIGDKGALSPR